MKSFKEFILEKSPPSKSIQRWLKNALAGKYEWVDDFKKRYGKEWKSVLMGRAWNILKSRNRSKVDEEVMSSSILHAVNNTTANAEFIDTILFKDEDDVDSILFKRKNDKEFDSFMREMGKLFKEV